MKNREAIETLEKRRVHLEKKVCVQTQEAQVKAGAGDRSGALFALKRRKAYQQELDQVSNAHMTLERQILNLESAQSTSLAVGALQSGVLVQQQLSRKNDLNKMDKLMDELQEQQELQNEFNQVLSQGNSTGVDDSVLLAELDVMQAQHLDEKLASAASVPMGAIAPTSPPVGYSSTQPLAEAMRPSSNSTFSMTAPPSGTSSIVGLQLPSGSSALKSDEEQLRLLQAELG